MTVKASREGTLLFVPVTVDGWAFSFILDSGFEMTVIDAGTARALRIMRSSAHEERASGASVSVGSTKPVTIALRPRGTVVGNREVATIPLDGLAPAIGRRCQGIVGQDIFRRFVVSIDYASGTVRLYDPVHYAAPLRAARLPLTIEADQPIVPATVFERGRAPIRLAVKVDTGSASGLALDGGFVRGVHLVPPGARRLREPGAALGGANDNIVTRADALVLGPYRIRAPILSYSNDLTLSTGHAGTIGGELLSRFTVTFDYARRRLYLEPNAALAGPERFDASGLVLRAGIPANTIVVTGVLPGTPAAKAGIRPGDVIAEIGGRSVGGGGIIRVRDRLTRAGRVTLNLRRVRPTPSVNLLLRPLI